MFSLENRRQANFLYSTDGFISGKHDNRTQNRLLDTDRKSCCLLSNGSKEEGTKETLSYLMIDNGHKSLQVVLGWEL